MANNKRGWTSKESFNWDEVSTEKPPALDAGIYHFEVSAADANATSKGQAGLKVQLKFTQPFGGSEADIADRSVKCFDNLAITREAAFKVKQLATACSIDPPASSSFEDVEEFARQLVESSGGLALVAPNTWNGQTNNSVKRYMTAEQAAEQSAGVSGSDDPAPAPAMQRRKRGAAAAAE